MRSFLELGLKPKLGPTSQEVGLFAFRCLLRGNLMIDSRDAKFLGP